MPSRPRDWRARERGGGGREAEGGNEFEGETVRGKERMREIEVEGRREVVGKKRG